MSKPHQDQTGVQESVQPREAASPPILERDGACAVIRLNRPRHLNRLQPEDLDVLLKLFAESETDPALRVLVLTGTGFQTPFFDQVPAAHLYHSVAALLHTGQDFTARMIASEALSRT